MIDVTYIILTGPKVRGFRKEGGKKEMRLHAVPRTEEIVTLNISGEDINSNIVEKFGGHSIPVTVDQDFIVEQVKWDHEEIPYNEMEVGGITHRQLATVYVTLT